MPNDEFTKRRPNDNLSLRVAPVGFLKVIPNNEWPAFESDTLEVFAMNWAFSTKVSFETGIEPRFSPYESTLPTGPYKIEWRVESQDTIKVFSDSIEIMQGELVEYELSY